jgi:hypothetical protein
VVIWFILGDFIRGESPEQWTSVRQPTESRVVRKAGDRRARKAEAVKAESHSFIRFVDRKKKEQCYNIPVRRTGAVAKLIVSYISIHSDKSNNKPAEIN